MFPLIIIPEGKEEITLKTDTFKKYISDAYYSGYNEGCEKGKYEQSIQLQTSNTVYRSDDNLDFLK